MNSNNIYTILNKLESLNPKATTEEQTQKKIYESVEAKGSILEGVDAVEARLSKQFAESKIEEKAVSKAQQKFMGMVYAAKKGEKPASPEVAKVAKGMSKKSAKDFAKTKHAGLPQHVEAAEVCAECGMTEGECEHTRMAEGEVEKTKHGIKHTKKDYPGYPSDDINNDEESGKAGRPRKHAKKEKPAGEKKGRGRPKKEKEPFSGADKAGKSLQDIMVGKLPAKSSVKGRVHKMDESMNNKKLNEGVNFAEMLKEKHATVDEMLEELANDIKLFKETGHCSDLLRDCMDIRGYGKSQLADAIQPPVVKNPPSLIGQDLVTPQERLAPHQTKPGAMGAVKDVAKGMKDWLTGKPESGPTYEEVTLEDELNELAKLAGLASEGNAFTGKLAATPKGGKFELDGKEYTDTSTLDEEPNEGNAFTGKLAQTKKGDKFELDGKEYTDTSSLDEEELEEDKIDVADAPEAQNKPKPKYASIKNITTQGDDLNREKSQDPHTANKAANPLTNENTLSLEARLAAEYESIKKVAK